AQIAGIEVMAHQRAAGLRYLRTDLGDEVRAPAIQISPRIARQHRHAEALEGGDIELAGEVVFRELAVLCLEIAGIEHAAPHQVAEPGGTAVKGNQGVIEIE